MILDQYTNAELQQELLIRAILKSENNIHRLDVQLSNSHRKHRRQLIELEKHSPGIIDRLRKGAGQ